jgi:hypothetical protein
LHDVASAEDVVQETFLAALIDPQTASLAVAAGVNLLVSGTSVFDSGQTIATTMKRLQTAGDNALKHRVT